MNTNIETHKKSVIEAKLEDGTIVYADAVADNPNAYNSKMFTLIGPGTYYKINGILQEGVKTYFFFKSTK